MYTITLTSGIQNIGEDTLQMKLIFNVNAAGSNVNFSFAEKGIRVLDWGSNKLSFDLDDPLLVPAEYSCQLSDDLGYLKELFFNKTALGKATSKRPEIQIYVNGEIDYIGIVKDQNGFNYNFANNRIKLSTDAFSENLNLFDLFDDEGNPTNVLAYTEHGSVQLIQMFEDIFSYIGNPVSYSSGSLIINQDWIFKGLLSTWLEDITFPELRLFVDPIFFINDKQIENLGGVLKRIALEHGAMVGFTRKDMAFFNKLYKYDPLNSQNLVIRSHSGGQPIPSLTYVETTSRIEGHRTIIASPAGTSARIGKNKQNFGALYIDCANGFYWDDTLPDDKFGTNTLALRGSDYYNVYYAKDPSIVLKDRFGIEYEWANKSDLVSKFWWTHRGQNSITECIIKPTSKEHHNFSAKGIAVNYLKGFPYDGEGFQIIEMEKLYGSGMTNLKAVNCGELE